MIDGLTPKREAFARAYVELGCAAQAYRAAFNAENMAPETVRNKASQTLARDDVRAMVDAIRAELAQRHHVTLDSLLNELEDARKSASALGMPQASIAATLGKAKLLGLDKPGTNLDIEIKRLAAEKLRLEVEAMAGKDRPGNDGQDRPPEYVLAPDGPVPDDPIL